MIGNNFILESKIDKLICDQLIEYHKRSPKQIGRVGNHIDLQVKDSTDSILERSSQEYHNYFSALGEVVAEYIKKYPFCNYYSSWQNLENTIITYYKPTQSYQGWHTERSVVDGLCGSRHLVFMTYLNDVEDGGGTEFYHQRKLIKARKGKTLIWPADWTHTHRGIVSSTQEKYIVTGWFNFTPS
jgi:hypothetical protein